jgi:DNA repair exonuclease SbcCD ATPase subunit
MQQERKPQSNYPRDSELEKRLNVVALPAIPSFSFGDAKNILDIEVQADQLLNYINKLTSLADRACTTALQQSETTQRVEDNRHSEVIYLRRQLDQANAQFREQQHAMTRLEQASRAQLTTLEKQLHRKEIETMEREIDALRSNAGSTIVRQPSKQTEEPRQSVVPPETAPLNQELAHLKQQLAARDETIETKNRMIKAVESDFQTKIADLEQRLRNTQQELQIQEANLKEKDTLLQATAAKEVEMGNLIKRLSGECEQLNQELQEISQSRSSVDANKIPSGGETKIWRRVIGRLQEGL